MSSFWVPPHFDELESNSRYLAVDGALIDKYEEDHTLADQQSKKVQQQITAFHPAAPPSNRASSDWRQGFERRRKDYQTARGLLGELIDKPDAGDARIYYIYERLVGGIFGRLWHSSGISRRKGSVQSDPSRYQSLVRVLHEHLSEEVGQVFDRGRGIVTGRAGMGVNVITETLHTLSSYKHCVVNKRSVEKIGLKIGPPVGIPEPGATAKHNPL